MNYDNFCITILDGSKCSVLSNIGNCHYFDELYRISELGGEMKIYNLV